MPSPILRTLTLALCALVATLPAQDEAQALTALAKAFTPPPKGKATLDDKQAALQAVARYDSGKVAAAIADAWSHVDGELQRLEAQEQALQVELAALRKLRDDLTRGNMPANKAERLKAIPDELAALRPQPHGLRTLLGQVGDRLAALRTRDSALWLLHNVCGNKKHSLLLRLCAARCVGGAAGDVMEELAAALPKAKDATEQIVLLDAMALAGRTAQLHAGAIVALLDSKEEAVAERAAMALAKLAVPDGIGKTIALLARSSGQTRMRIAAALEVLTGEQFGINTSAWQAWWQATGAKITAGGTQLGKGIPSHRKATDKFYYFGIPQDQSNAILYVIDCSGSMKAPVKLPQSGTAAGGETKETTRLEACKTELIRALGLLRPQQKFAVLWYDAEPHWWEEKMQPATEDAVWRAKKFVKELTLGSTTNIHDTLETGFDLVGRGSRDKYYGIELDTIFLMTDGSPTTPDGKLDSVDKILTGVRLWNPLKRVTIHCIAIGKDLNADFLRQLASENGGEFKQF
jgi:hypothetical protein